MSNILYLWDLADTLFHEQWNQTLTGFDSYESYAQSLGIEPGDARKFENACKTPYLQGEMFALDVMDGFCEVLTWCKHNQTFSTGVPEQMDWRAAYLKPKLGYDVRDFFERINSTFDYAETNQKTKDMLVSFLQHKIVEGYITAVYTDDKLTNCRQFLESAQAVKEQVADFRWRIYHMKNDGNGLRPKEWYVEIGNLRDIITAESKHRKL